MADEEERKPRLIGRVLRQSQVGMDPVRPVAEQAPPAGAPPPPPKRPAVVSAGDYEAGEKAKQIVAEAHAMAARILQEAEVQKQEIFDKTAADAKSEVMAQASEELARAKMQAGQVLQAMEGEIVQLALKIAAKIIGRDLERDPEVVAEIAATAIEHARAAKAMVLRVNPVDGATLRKARPKLMELIGRTVELSIRDDADIEQGGCVVQTEFGTIDGQIRTQFEMLKNVLAPDEGSGRK
jgi:type III secretion protein L